MPNRTRNYYIRFGYAYESVTVSDSAVGVTASKAKDANRVFITAEDGDMRFRYDGANPAASEGHLLTAGDTLVIDGAENIAKFKAIKTGTTDGTLKVTFEDGMARWEPN